jgi:hypothetical protein
MTSDIIEYRKLLNRLSEYQLLKTGSFNVRVETLPFPAVLGTLHTDSPPEDRLL